VIGGRRAARAAAALAILCAPGAAARADVCGQLGLLETVLSDGAMGIAPNALL